MALPKAKLQKLCRCLQTLRQPDFSSGGVAFVASLSRHQNAPDTFQSTSSSFVDEMRERYFKDLMVFDAQLCSAAQDNFRIPTNEKAYRRHVFRSVEKAIVGRSNRFLIVVGSSGTGLAGVDSDIDLVLFTSKDPEHRQKTKPILESKQGFMRYMRLVVNGLQKSCKGEFLWGKTEIIPHAKVPILVLMTKTKLKLEIQLDSEDVLRTTLFLRNSVAKDPRIPVLIFWAQKWLKVLNLKDSRRGLFSSYHIALLVVHFLQNRLVSFDADERRGYLSKDFPLESIAEVLYTKQPEIPVLSSGLEPTVTELLLHFIDYYSTLNLHDVVVPAAECEVRRREETEEDDRLWITDPFSVKNRCGVRRGTDRFSEAVLFTKEALLNGKGLCWPLKYS